MNNYTKVIMALKGLNLLEKIELLEEILKMLKEELKNSIK